jgi:serine/threonine protein kinase
MQAISRMSPASDVWALGVTLCQMIYGKLPFWSTGSSYNYLYKVHKLHLYRAHAWHARAVFHKAL